MTLFSYQDLSGSLRNKTRAANIWDLVETDPSWVDIMLGEANEVVERVLLFQKYRGAFLQAFRAFVFQYFVKKPMNHSRVAFNKLQIKLCVRFFQIKQQICANVFHNEAKVIGKCAKEPLNNFVA